MTEDDAHAVLARYVACFSAGDTDGVAALYAADATIEDPLGAEPMKGRDEIRAFYGRAAEKGATIELAGPVRARGNECASPLRARVPFGDDVMEIEIVDVMTFDDDARITSMRAFWGEANVRIVPT